MQPASTRQQRRSASVEFDSTGTAAFWIAVLWALALAAIFFRYRGADVGKLPQTIVGLLAGFTGGFTALQIAAACGQSLAGALLAGLIVLSWFGVGELLQRVLKLSNASSGDAAIYVSTAPGTNKIADVAWSCAWGAGATALVWFGLGWMWLYKWPVAAGLLLIGVALGLVAVRRLRSDALPWQPNAKGALSRVTSALVLIPLLLAGVAALAPPTAKDTLLYHISLPKMFLGAGGIVDAPGNIAQYYPLGAEMNGLWAMLAGRIISPRVGEAAFGAVEFAYLPLLMAALYGLAGKYGASDGAAKIAAALTACVPTVYASASSGYNDVALALYLLVQKAQVKPAWVLLGLIAIGLLLAALGVV